MKKYYLILATMFTVVCGCKKDFLSLEVNPNLPSVTTPQLTLAAALAASANIVAENPNGDYLQYGVWGGYWTTSGNYVPNQGLNQYLFTNASFQTDWTDWFGNLTNYNNLQGIAAKDPTLANYQAIAMVMKAYGFQHLVDNYNDVPYSQAFQASTILFPAYDKAQAIYTDLFKQIDAAIAMMGKAGAATPGSDDIVFQGDMTKWKKFANSLKLRMAIRVSGVSGFDAKAIMATTVSSADAAGTETNFLGENIEAYANPGYANAVGKQSPFYGNASGFGYDPTGNPSFGNLYYRANSFCVNMLKNFNDPRVSRFYTLVPTSATDTTQRVHGNTFGDTHSTLLTNTYTSAIGPGLVKSATQGAAVFSGAESLFLQAEAVQKGYLSGDAQSLYNAGITSSFQDLGLTSAQATTYYSQNLVNVGWSVSDPETAIITQKWIALNGYFVFEAWNEYRRTLIPNLPSTIDPAAQSATLPTRLYYPLSEYQTNPDAVAKEGTINPFSSKIFWAK